jgi:hypothetical protein
MRALAVSGGTSRGAIRFLAVLLFLLLSVSGFGLGATDITVTPDPLWAPTFNVANLSGAAGTDFASPLASASNQVNMNVGVRIFPSHPNWILTVKKSDISWSPTLTLQIRRTGDGTGSGTIDAGSLNVWRTISAVDTELCRGTQNRTNIPGQVQVLGLSVSLGVRTLSTTVIFTVTDS